MEKVLKEISAKLETMINILTSIDSKLSTHRRSGPMDIKPLNVVKTNIYSHDDMGPSIAEEIKQKRMRLMAAQGFPKESPMLKALEQKIRDRDEK